jgi:hypothetical protein
MKTNLLSFFLLLYSLNTFSQDSIYVLPKGQYLKYRKGYVITSKNDTIKGLIRVDTADKISFIKDSIKIKLSLFKEPSSIPYYQAGDGNIKAFYRNGLYYEVYNIPPGNGAVFLNVLEHGPINLYRQIYDYGGGNSAFNIMPGALGLLVTIANAANHTDRAEEEFFEVKAYYVQKGKDGQILFVPGGEKKYREVVYPLIKDNPAFLKSLVGQYFDFQHLVENIKEYNFTLKNK